MHYYSHYQNGFIESPLQASPWFYINYIPLPCENIQQFQTFQPFPGYQPQISQAYTCFSLNQDSLTGSLALNHPENTPSLLKTKASSVETSREKGIQRGKTKKVSSNERFVQKNVQANSLNHIFSFISNENKTQWMVMQIFHNNKFKCQRFYQCWKLLRAGNRKPVTRQFLDWALGRDDEKGLDKFMMKKMKDCEELTSEEFSRCNRILMGHFLRQQKANVLLTSNKIRSTVYLRHLRKYRELLMYFLNKQ